MWARRDGGEWAVDVPPLWLDVPAGRRVDLRSRDRALLAYHGWHQVTETPQPGPVAGHVWEPRVRMVRGVLTQVWEARQMTPEEAAAADDAEATVPTLEDRIAALERIVFGLLHDAAEAPVESLPVITGTMTSPIRPEGVGMHDGKRWQNTSGAWLVHGPDLYPRGWTLLDPPDTGGGAVAAWSPDATYKPGSMVTDLGTVWVCLIGHGPERQGTWRPGPATQGTVWQVAA